MTVETIKAVGDIIVPLVTAFLGFLQAKCRRDLNIAHAKLRSKESGRPWQDELRNNYRLFRRRGKRASTTGKTGA